MIWKSLYWGCSETVSVKCLCYTNKMLKPIKYFFYGVGIFLAMFYIWYATGGPMRDTKSRPFITPNVKGEGFNYSDTFK